MGSTDRFVHVETGCPMNNIGNGRWEFDPRNDVDRGRIEAWLKKFPPSEGTNLSVQHIPAKDWPADPWPKCEPVRIDYDAMEVVPADHFGEPVIVEG